MNLELDYYHILFKESPCPMWILDQKTLQFLEVNDAAVKQYGYSKEDFLHLKLQDIRFDGNVHREKKMTLRAVVKSQDLEAFYDLGNSLHKRKNGETFYVHVYSQHLRLNGRDILLAFLMDDNERVLSNMKDKELREKMLVDEQNLIALINNTSDTIWSIDVNMKLISFNQPFKDLMFDVTGKIPEAGDFVLDIKFNKKSIKKWKEYYKKAFTGIQFKTLEETITNDKVVYKETYFNPIHDKAGKVIGASCFSRDVTDEKKILKQIQIQNEKLQEIAWIQSHKVRAPVATLLGLIGLFDVETKNQNNKEILKKIKEVAEGLDEVIREIDNKTRKH